MKLQIEVAESYGDNVPKIEVLIGQLESATDSQLILFGISSLLDKINNPVSWRSASLEEEALRLSINRRLLK